MIALGIILFNSYLSNTENKYYGFDKIKHGEYWKLGFKIN